MSKWVLAGRGRSEDATCMDTRVLSTFPGVAAATGGHRFLTSARRASCARGGGLVGSTTKGPPSDEATGPAWRGEARDEEADPGGEGVRCLAFNVFSGLLLPPPKATPPTRIAPLTLAALPVML
mmetsp:Transcript_121193/g.387130  ORF Transcript_121193/g.387130 Transcript_121193/m.387130 type:complete len:124 (+) Transcript_121193:823-1194(+)